MMRTVAVIITFVFLSFNAPLNASGEELPHLDSLINTLSTLDNDTNKARVLLEIGWEYRRVDRINAIAFTERSRELSIQVNNRKGISSSLNNLGVFYSDSGLYERSIKLTKQSLAIDKELGDSAGMVLCLLNIADDYVQMGEPNEALEYTNKALVIERLRDNIPGMAVNLFRKAKIYEDMANFILALECYEQSLVYYEELGSEAGTSKALGNIGIMHEYNGAYDLAIKYYLKALAIAEKQLAHVELPGIEGEIEQMRFIMVNLLSSLGAVYCYLGEYDRAMGYMQWSYRLNNKYENKAGIAGSLNNMGMVLKYQGKYIEALESYMKSLAISEELGDKWEIAGIYNNIAVVYYEKGDNMDMVKEYLEKSLQLKREVGHTLGIVLGLNNLGELYMDLGEYEKAIDYSKQSLNMAVNIGSKDDIMFACEILSGTYEKMGDYKNAYAYFLQYSSAKDTLFNEDKSKEIGKLEAEYEMTKRLEEEKRGAEELERIRVAEKTRSDNLQYSGILIFLVLLGIAILSLGKLTIPIRLGEGMIFFTFLLLFEFMLVLLDSYIEKYSGGEPAYKLIFNALLAMCIFPLHAFFESKLVSRLVKQR